ncbi:phage virion morphogenesis protein [Conchiformibius steedae]|uniref:Phage virion morphogenesis protein n=1 Tax=Conchiformibius steedae TaxID=153493 RepID=A0A3P2A244_9NEIS|nr:phage virion morphogenesis protein [Conchiformibius steedae]RRD89055.1 phage virion morphogenesis protein [Conchiformibius steedae]
MSSLLNVSSDLGAAANLLTALHGRLGDSSKMRRTMGAIATLLENSTRKRFETKTAPDGTPWAAWKPSTVRRYAVTVGKTRKQAAHTELRDPQRLLRDTGHLLNSITSHATENLAQVGSNVFYTEYHQFGTPKMAARPMFGISERDRTDINDLLQQHLQRAIEGK